MGNSNFKLKVDLIPKTSWYNNLRKALSKNEWDRIRKKVYAEANYVCKICGVNGRLNCDEIWEFDDNKNIQRLKGLRALCDKCHNIKHIGFVQVQISKGILPEKIQDELANHFMHVNNVSLNEFNRHIKEAFAIWQERSKKKWKIDLGNFDKFVAQKKLI